MFFLRPAAGAHFFFLFQKSGKNIKLKLSFADLVNVFENQKIFLKKGVINMEGFIDQENVYKVDSWLLQKVPPHIDKS